MTGPQGVDAQPVSHVEWVPVGSLQANSWNPNHVAPPERRLLKLSIVENGWTQPIVAHPGSGEIVDGYHRWELTGTDPHVADLTGGLVPVVRLAQAPPALARMATIRHNRARGTHHVVRMAELVRDLIDTFAIPPEEVGRRLQMDPEEVERLYQRGEMPRRGASPDGFGKGWVPA